MKAKKRVTVLFLALALITAMLTGCMGQEFAVTLKGDGSCVYTTKYYYEKSMYETMVQGGDVSGSILSTGDFKQTTETIDGKAYYVFTRDFSFPTIDGMRSFLTEDTAFYNGLLAGSKKPENYAASKESLHAPFDSVTLDAASFQASLSTDNTLASSSGMPQSMQTNADADVGIVTKDALGGCDSINEYYKSQGLIVNVSITMPAAITDSNGTVSGNTATWDICKLPDDNKLIAVTNGTPIADDKVAPTISGVKNNGIYKKKVTVTGEDDVSLPSFALNGVRLNQNKLSISYSGKYTVVATDANQNTASVKFTVDTLKPVIKGLRSGRISKKGITLRFSDNMGVKSVKINGKNANKKKVTIKKAGRYVVKVTDKAGNVTTAKFRIKTR